MVISIGSFFFRGLSLGVEFSGGVQVQVSFSNTVNVETLRLGLERAGFREEQVQYLGSSREAAIRLPAQTGQSGDVIRARVEGVLHAIDPRAGVTRLGAVSPQTAQQPTCGPRL